MYGFGLLRKTPDDLPVTRGQKRLDEHAVLEALERNPRSPAVLLANRGVVVFGRDNPVALARVLVSFEESAGIIINATAARRSSALSSGRSPGRSARWRLRIILTFRPSTRTSWALMIFASRRHVVTLAVRRALRASLLISSHHSCGLRGCWRREGSSGGSRSKRAASPPSS